LARLEGECVIDNRDILVVGTSAGGVEALLALAKGFTADFPACVLVTIHLPSHFPSALDEILSRVGPLPAAFATDHQAVKKGHIFVAPPERHLLVDGDELLLGTGPRENKSRPAIDPMLRSAAVCCGYRAVGVILSGTLSDGTSGLSALNQCGAITVVQNPASAAFPEMPLAALRDLAPDHVADLSDMPALLGKLVREPAGKPVRVPLSLKYEVDIARGGHDSIETMDRIGRRSVLSCPDCGGVMWEVDDGVAVHYRCHVGHAHNSQSMLLELQGSLGRALATALRVLDERLALVRKLHRQAVEEGRALLAEAWAKSEADCEQEAKTIRNAIDRLDQGRP
jgi:two-component system, chemotaxis family, protein-glutamate methylesterase/glutaminase